MELSVDFLSLGRGSINLYSESPSAHSRYIVSALT